MPPADWQLPPGVGPGLWDYLHSPDLARDYDARLAGTPLLEADVRFCAAHFPRPGRLVDLGCGTGRLLVPFARRGYAVVGVDLSAPMLRVARRRAREAGVAVDLVQANLVALDCLAGGVFDYAACLFSTLGMVTGEAERRRVVGHAARLLRPGGRFVLHVHNYWHNLRDPAGRRWLAGDLPRRGTGDRPAPAHQGVGGFALHQFTRGEAVGLLRGAGLAVEEVRPVGLRADASLAAPWWLPGLRAYGYLLAACKPGSGPPASWPAS